MALAYDITRLALRLFNVTPNGIDRIDFALAEHFLKSAGADRCGALAFGLWPRLIASDAARAVIEAIGQHWGETEDPEQDPVYLGIIARLTGHTRNETLAAKTGLRSPRGPARPMGDLLRRLARYGAPIGRSPKKDLPLAARYINVSQFPLWMPAYFKWLESRRDVKAVFFIHDLLPIEMPGYFRDGELERHRRRLANVARFGAAAMVTSEVVREGVADCMRGLGRADMPVFAAAIPCAPIFSSVRIRDPQLSGIPYFVCCSTIEPRKNHLMLLNVWRKLAGSDGKAAPKLVIVGVRGWKYDAVVDLLERSPQLRGLVVEVNGLSSPALKRLLDEARALLMPSFAEGYGLPVREALAAGVPVLASDIPAFREIKDEKLELLNPIDGEAWLAAIRRAATRQRCDDGLVCPSGKAASWAAYFAEIGEFLAKI
jgi:glycosyltransferase involved in cell wall biosynthesis